MMKSINTSLLSLFVIILLYACNNEKLNVKDEADKISINFGLLESKGTLYDNNNILNYGVLAYYSDVDILNIRSSVPNFMNNVEVTKKNSAWSYSPAMYWPVNGKLTFFAYSPYTAYSTQSLNDLWFYDNTNLQDKGYPVFFYLASADVKKHIDFMITDFIYNKSISDTDFNGKVHLEFKHLVSAIQFNAKVEGGSSTPIKIESIKISNLKNNGHYNMDLNSWYFDVNKNSSIADYQVSILDGTLSNTNISEHASGINITTGNGVIMPVPQVSPDNSEVTVSINVYNNGLGNAPTTEVITKKLKDLIPELEVGKKYTISIEYGGYGNITINSIVEPWTNKNIDVPAFN